MTYIDRDKFYKDMLKRFGCVPMLTDHSSSLNHDILLDEALNMQSTADVEEVKHGDLSVEIRTDCFKDQNLAKEQGWYRKFFSCPSCGLLIRTETWDDHYMFGKSTVLKSNETPKCCPECGIKLKG